MSTLIDYVASRLNRACSLMNEGLDAVTKSLRAYPTSPHPAFLERLQHYMVRSSTSKSVQGKTFAYSTEKFPMSGSNVVNFLLQSFYDQEQGSGEENIIYLKISSKTMDHHQPLNSLRETTVEWAQSLFNERKGYTDLISLIEHELGPDSRAWMDNYGCSPVSQAIEGHLMCKANSFSPVTPLAVPGRNDFTKELSMSVRYYETRDDNRAYCIDKNKLRSLTGCMLHRLICPRNKSTRRRLQSSNVLRPDEKDMLNLKVSTSYSENTCTFLILGDISNFTGSLANSWLMLHCMARDIASSKLKFAKTLFSIGDTLVSARWLDIIATYLYLTVGIPVWVEDKSSYDFLPGGYLGVAANITIGLLFLSFSMTYAMKSLRPMCYDITGQAGGDDHAYLVTCLTENKEQIILALRDHMSQYVGHLKEFSVTYLDTLQEGVIPNATFCRKRIVLRRTAHTIELRGEVTFPIPVSILPFVLVPYKERQQAWTELDLAMIGYESRVGDTDRIGDMFRMALIRKYPNIRPVRIKTVSYWLNRTPLRKIDGHWLTEAAFETISCTIPYISTYEHNALISSETRLRHAVCASLIVPKQIVLDNEPEVVYICNQEKISHLVRKERTEVWYKPCDSVDIRLLKFLK